MTIGSRSEFLSPTCYQRSTTSCAGWLTTCAGSVISRPPRQQALCTGLSAPGQAKRQSWHGQNACDGGGSDRDASHPCGERNGLGDARPSKCGTKDS